MKHIAINGYGRIGQSVLRAIYESGSCENMKVVAINSLAPIETIAYMTRYDSNHGRFPANISVEKGDLVINGDYIRILSSPEPEDIEWKDLDIDLMFECTGSFKDKLTASRYLNSGVKKIIYSHPATNDVDATIVFGFNHDDLDPKQSIVSAGSCTTNCVVPILKILDENWKIQNGMITTIHSSMNDQPMVDSSNVKDLRLSRSGSQSIIPIETSLSKGIERFFPNLGDKFNCSHVRVPTTNVSAMDLSINLVQETSVQELNRKFVATAKGMFKGIIDYTEEPHASVDFNHDVHSCILDGTQTKVNTGRMIKLFCWFDNEWGFSNRLVDIANHWLKKSL